MDPLLLAGRVGQPLPARFNHASPEFRATLPQPWRSSCTTHSEISAILWTYRQNSTEPVEREFKRGAGGNLRPSLVQLTNAMSRCCELRVAEGFSSRIAAQHSVDLRVEFGGRQGRRAACAFSFEQPDDVLDQDRV